MAKPIVVVDARMAGRHAHGIGRYVEGLLEGLLSETRPFELIAIVGEHPSIRLLNLRTRGLRFARAQASFLNPLELFEIPRILKQLGASLYHSPSFSSLLRCNIPYVVTIHDLNHLRFGSWLNRQYYKRVLRPFAKNASVVMTVSGTARDEIAEWLSVPSSEVRVLWNPIELMERSVDRDALLESWSLKPRSFFLCVTNPKPHKNWATLLAAYGGYRNAGGKWPLAVTLEGEIAPGVISLGNVAEGELAELLASAGALFTPSLYEGFGRPPVEALLMETPVVASDIPVHREALDLASDGEVIWVPPLDQDGWTQALSKVERSGMPRPSDETRWDVAFRHNPTELAKALDEVYRSVLGLSR